MVLFCHGFNFDFGHWENGVSEPFALVLADQHPLPDDLSAWAKRWNWTVTEHVGQGLELEWKDQTLALCQRHKKLPRVDVDLIELWRRTKINQKDPFAKAIGLRHGLCHVVEATTGLGGDLIKLLKLGCEVVAIEGSPVIFALLMDGWRRANLDPRWVQGGGSRSRLQFGQAEEVLLQLAPLEREVIFLDPMYPEKSKTALSKGEMQVLQDLFADETDRSSDLFAAAHALATKRVVMKRPRRGPKASQKPDLEFLGASTRYDVWLKNSVEKFTRK